MSNDEKYNGGPRKDLVDYGFKFVKSFEPEEPIVAMIEFSGTIFVATQKSVYRKIDDELVPIHFLVPEEIA